MRNPAKRRRLATGVAALLCLFLFLALFWASLDNALGVPAEIGFLLAVLAGIATLGLMIASAMIERASEAAITPFWMRLKPSFWGSILLAPVAVLTLGVALIPTGYGVFLIFSLFFGAPIYALVGVPIAWFALKRGASGPLWGAAVGVAATLAGAPLTLLVMLIAEPTAREALEGMLFIHGFGLIFGPIYGAVAGLLFDGLYGRTRRRLLGRAASRQKPALDGAPA